MKKIFIIGFFALLIIQACKKDQELIDGKRPEERVAENLEKYRNELINSPNGWVAYLNTTLVGGGYNFYMSFDKNNRVIMRADYDSDFALESFESTYRVKQVMAPSLIFDTYTLLHLLQDPDPNSFDGDYSVGYGSDFEFEIREQVGDTIKLIGKKRNAPLILVKATADQKAFYTSDKFSDNIEGITKFLTDNPFVYILDPKDNTKKIQVSMSADVRSRSFALISTNAGQIATSSGLFSFSDTGVRLNTPVKQGDVIYTSLNWDNVAKKLYLVSSTGTKSEVLISATPILPLHLLLGVNYASVTIPNTTTYPGWGTEFISRRALANQRTSANIVVGTTPVTLGAMRFTFNATAKTMVLIWNTPYGANSLNLTYPYSFSKTNDGVFKFTIGSGFDANSAFIYNQASKPLDPILAERLNVDDFKLDYFINPSNGAILGQFISVQHPDFKFSGTLQ
ncbi:DUF4302 domain-containing protein [Pedobacter sp. UBA5917]|jgi:hypothetical protein|uniref:DUF4302 domain-containing protein n=1 Tax=Pedobacter sp. UBA5917 TaxID=1947061 RepID=UPI0025E9EE47|nr:DUF4302 domain-containing protein [Pedobacter sp. UBA5917]